MTRAEQMEPKVSNDDEGDIVFDNAIVHRTKGGDSILEYGDGSVLSLAEEIMNNDAGRTFASMAEMRECMSAYEEVYADNIVDEPESPENLVRGNRPLYMVLEGTVVDDGHYVDLPFSLNNITRHGKLYPHFGSTDCFEYDGSLCPITYTSQLAANVGKWVKIKCAKGSFREERCSTRGNSYFVDTDFLHSATVLAVVEKPGLGVTCD